MLDLKDMQASVFVDELQDYLQTIRVTKFEIAAKSDNPDIGEIAGLLQGDVKSFLSSQNKPCASTVNSDEPLTIKTEYVESTKLKARKTGACGSEAKYKTKTASIVSSSDSFSNEPSYLGDIGTSSSSLF